MHQMSQDDSLRFTLFQSQRATYMCFRDISYRDQLLGGSTWIGSFVLHNSSCNKNISYMDRHQLVHQLTRRFCIHLEDDPWNRARSFICPLVFPTNASSCSQDHVIHLANLITGNDDTILPFMNTTRLHVAIASNRCTSNDIGSFFIYLATWTCCQCTIAFLVSCMQQRWSFLGPLQENVV